MKIELFVLKVFEDILGFFPCHSSVMIFNKITLG